MTWPARSGRRSALTACLHTDAVLERIRCYLDGETLLSAIQVDSAWYDAMTPALYRDITMRFDSPFLQHPATSRAGLQPTRPRSKWSNLRYCRTLRLYDHDHLVCRVEPARFAKLSGLVHLELAGGGLSRQAPFDTHLCSANFCPVVKACTKIRDLTLRSLRGFQAVVPPVPALARLTLILRPCQLPPEPSTPSSSTYTVPIHTLEAILTPLTSVQECTIILWDERHVHRLDHLPICEQDLDALPQWFGTDFVRATRPSKKGCGCDESPVFHIGTSAMDRLQRLVYALGRWTHVRRVVLGNWERTAGGFDLDLQLIENAEAALSKDLARGRDCLDEVGGSRRVKDTDDAATKIVLINQERVAREYFTPGAEETPYWDLRYRPTPRVTELRDRVKHGRPYQVAMLDLWREEELADIGKWPGGC